MLRDSLVVHGADLEKLARAAIRDSGLRLSWDREEDLLAELVAVAWELSERHDEEKHPGQFAAGCYRRLRLRIIDHVRRTEGQTRWQFSAEGAQRAGRRHTRTLEQDGKHAVVVEHQRPTTLSLDAPVGDDNGGSLGDTVASLVVDAAADSDEGLRRALRSRDSEGGRPSEEERRGAAGRARGGSSRTER